MMSLSPTVDFGVSVSAGSDEVVLHLRGEADLATAPVLQEALTSPLASDPSYQRLVLDFEELQFIDSYCIGIIADAWTDLSQIGRDLDRPLAGAHRPPGAGHLCGWTACFAAQRA